MDAVTFGQKLIDTLDLDPVYVLLAHSNLPQGHLDHWLMAYWCFYHVGTASWVLDQPDYWGAMETAAGSKDYPRSAERRHFRGQNAVRSVAYLRSRGVEGLLSHLRSERSLTVGRVMKEVQTWVGFGPWIAFKVADMVERLGINAVAFDNGAMFLFDSPREGAGRLWDEVHGGERPGRGMERWAVRYLLSRLGVFLAPPRFERNVNELEVETVLCKWNSYRKGHYHLGEDIAACRKALTAPVVGGGETCQRLFEAGREVGLWSV